MYKKYNNWKLFFIGTLPLFVKIKAKKKILKIIESSKLNQKGRELL